MELTDEMIAQANKRGSEARKRSPVATSVRYDRRIGRVVIALSSGLELAFAPHLAQGLEAAKPSDLQEIEISPSGLGVHFPKLDADLYLPSLLEGGRAQRVRGRSLRTEKAYHMTDLTQDCTANKRGDGW